MTWEAYSDEEAEIVRLLIATDIEDLELSHKYDAGGDWEYTATCSKPRGWRNTDHFAAHVLTRRGNAKGRVMVLERLMILIGQRTRYQLDALHEMEKSGL